MSNVDSKTDFIKDLSNAARENPAATALIGMGLVWMLFGGRSIAKVGSVFGQIPDAARDSLGTATEAVKSTFDRASEGVAGIGAAVGSATSSAYAQAAALGSNYSGQASENFRGIPAFGVEALDSARATLARTFEAQPLALGAIGLAIGAGIAAALPATDIETEYLAETSGRFQERAREMVGDQLGNVVERVQDVAQAVASEAEKQGLTADGLSSMVDEVSDKVARVAKSATSSARAT